MLLVENQTVSSNLVSASPKLISRHGRPPWASIKHRDGSREYLVCDFAPCRLASNNVFLELAIGLFGDGVAVDVSSVCQVKFNAYVFERIIQCK